MNIERIKTKLSHFKLNFNPPATEEEVKNFESEAGIELPKDYYEFITTIGNGVGIHNFLELEEWDYSYYIENTNLTKHLKFACYLSPNCQITGDGDKKWYEELYEKRNIDLEYKLWDPMFGTMAFMEFGCGLYFSMILNGPHKGRIFSWGDFTASKPTFYSNNNFYDWLEESLDAALDGKSVHFLTSKSKWTKENYLR